MASEHEELDQNKVEETEAKNDKAVADLSPELYIKHPLQNRWALWFYKSDKSKDWTANLKLITAFDTVEDFWALFNHIQPASRIPLGCDYSVFKDGIQPMWEDDRNQRGGRWLINLNKQQRSTDLDKFWLETLLCLIGEAFDDYSDDICGAVVNIRNRGDKLGLWTADANHAEANKKIGKRLKDRLSVNVTIGFQAHADTQIKQGSSTKNRFTV